MLHVARGSFLAFLMALWTVPVYSFPADVVGILDGDTIIALSSSNQQTRCRLYGIDAPEKFQPYGERSKQSLSDLIYRKRVDVEAVGSDKYGRTICRISVGDRDISRAQIERGMAWVYRRYTTDSSYIAAESSARGASRGLWQDKKPVPPWDYRVGRVWEIK